MLGLGKGMRLFESQPGGYFDGGDSVGTVNGSANGDLVDNDTIGHIVLAAGQNGINYNFGELLAGS